MLSPLVWRQSVYGLGGSFCVRSRVMSRNRDVCLLNRITIYCLANGPRWTCSIFYCFLLCNAVAVAGNVCYRVWHISWMWLSDTPEFCFNEFRPEWHFKGLQCGACRVVCTDAWRTIVRHACAAFNNTFVGHSSFNCSNKIFHQIRSPVYTVTD